MKKGLLAIIFLLTIPLALGATIHGKVFDYNFRLAANSIVKINTVPEQKMVAVDGSYSFTVPKGEYTLTAFVNDETEQLVYYVEDNISVVEEGDYVRDLILFPYEDLSELDLNGEFDELIIIDEPKKTSFLLIVFYVLGGVVIIIALLVLAFGSKKEKRKEEPETQVAKTGAGAAESAKAETVKPITTGEEPDELEKVLAFIKAHRRVTQKDIRKEFPLSEAKISLIITDLESQAKVRKIKKGRGNIIIYNDK